MKRLLCAIALLFLAAPLAFAECPYIDVSLVDNAQVKTGVQAAYPITLTNTGINAQFVSLAAECNSPLECSFSQAPYATLNPTQKATFLLYAKSSVAGSYQIPLSVSAGTQDSCDSRTLSLSVTQANQTSKPDFNLDFGPQANQSARPSEEITYSLKVTNNKDAKIFVRMSGEGFFSGATRFSYSDFEVAPGESKLITISILVPPGTPSNVYQQAFNARVTTTDGLQYYYTFPTQVFVYSDQLRLALQNEPSTCTIAVHNEKTDVTLRVRNDGEIEGPFDLDARAGEQASSILSVNPSILEVKAGDTQSVTISVNPKQSTILDVYPYQFILSYQGIPVFIRDYCFEVFAKIDFAVETLTEYAVGKGQVAVALPFSVWNNGTISQDFAVEVAPPNGLLVKIQPSSFTLSAGEKKQVNLVVTPSRNMKEGKVKLPVVVRTSKFNKGVTLNLNILPAGQTVSGEGVQFKQESVRAFAGVETRLFVALENTNDDDMTGVQLALEGIPAAWYSTQPTDIPAHSIQGASVAFNIPASEKASARKITARVLKDGDALAEKQMTLYVEIPQSKMELEVKDYQEMQTSSGKSLFINIVVRNTGQKPLTDVQASLPTGYYFALKPGNLLLQPGQSAEAVVRVDNPPSGNIPLKLKAQDGTESDQILVKAQPKPFQMPWLWVLIVFIALLALIYIFFKRRQENYA